MKDSQIAELEVLIRARYPIIYIVTWEEERVEHVVWNIARERNKKLFVWSASTGMIQRHEPTQVGDEQKEATSRRPARKHIDERSRDPLTALGQVDDYVEPAIFVLRDLHPYLGDAGVARKLRDVASAIKASYKTVVLVSPTLKLPFELQKDVTVLDFDLPDVPELEKLLDTRIEELKHSSKVDIKIEPQAKEKLLYAARGLTLNEAENVFAKTLVMARKLTEEEIPIILSEKEQAIRKSGMLEYYHPEEQFGDVGGLEMLKDWLKKRNSAFGERAKEFGLPAPKGALLLGVQGCGKSLCAKAVATLWQLPLLRLDVGKLFSDLVGSSERNVREAIKIAESVSPCILWVDEIEKAFAGTQSSAFSDAGTSARVFGTFLTWLQEKEASVFVIATANNIQLLPPELLRKGRLDEIFFVDLPTRAERAAIFAIHIRRRNRDPNDFDLDKLAAASEGFSGAEIEQAVISALYDVFEQGTTLSTEAVVEAVNSTVPLSTTMKEDIDALRQWAEGRARKASREVAEPVPTMGGRRIEL
ncbi:MAG: AAA family ATPase [Armatimonadetes bacterium]|nr:AAA family ATPase [Armatimonadota bacterium]